MSRMRIVGACLAVVVCAVALGGTLRRPAAAVARVLRGKKTVAERVEEFGPAVCGRLAPDFARVSVAYPPDGIVLVGLKHEKRLEVWVAQGEKPPRLLKAYPILGASGTLGPKLREGDRQVPEGLYRIESLNPNSLYHLALRVNYPNAFDRARGVADGRQDLGGDIMIHGKTCSIGCLAMGDEGAEELFVLAAETGIDKIDVILSPVDFRVRELPADTVDVPEWAVGLYDAVGARLKELAASPH